MKELVETVIVFAVILAALLLGQWVDQHSLTDQPLEIVK